MLIRIAPPAASVDLPSAITPASAYLNRRQLIAHSVAAGVLGSGLSAAWAQATPAPTVAPGKLTALANKRSNLEGTLATDVPTAYTYASTYNNLECSLPVVLITHYPECFHIQGMFLNKFNR